MEKTEKVAKRKHNENRQEEEKPKRKQKWNGMFREQRKKWEKIQDEKEAKQQQRQEAKKKVQESKKKRHELHGKLTKRTKTGQPVMKHLISHLVAKLEKESNE